MGACCSSATPVGGATPAGGNGGGGGCCSSNKERKEHYKIHSINEAAKAGAIVVDLDKLISEWEIVWQREGLVAQRWMPTVPFDEELRLKCLREYDVRFDHSELVFHLLVQLASAITACPVSMITLFDVSDCWIKASSGIDRGRLPREMVFDSHVLHHHRNGLNAMNGGLNNDSDVFVIADTKKDDRFATHPLVEGSAKIRSYAGAPLRTSAGVALGTICVMDTVPRTLNEWQKRALAVLSRQIVAELELRRKTGRAGGANGGGAQRRFHGRIPSVTADGSSIHHNHTSSAFSNATTSAYHTTFMNAESRAERVSRIVAVLFPSRHKQWMMNRAISGVGSGSAPNVPLSHVSSFGSANSELAASSSPAAAAAGGASGAAGSGTGTGPLRKRHLPAAANTNNQNTNTDDKSAAPPLSGTMSATGIALGLSLDTKERVPISGGGGAGRSGGGEHTPTHGPGFANSGGASGGGGGGSSSAPATAAPPVGAAVPAAADAASDDARRGSHQHPTIPSSAMIAAALAHADTAHELKMNSTASLNALGVDRVLSGTAGAAGGAAGATGAATPDPLLAATASFNGLPLVSPTNGGLNTTGTSVRPTGPPPTATAASLVDAAQDSSDARFSELMESADAQEQFLWLLTKHSFVTESLLFWEACDAYLAMPHVELGRAIYDLYVAPNSILEVNVPEETALRLTKLVDANRFMPNMFNQAQFEVFGLMSRDNFQRWENSEKYKSFYTRRAAKFMTAVVPASPADAATPAGAGAAPAAGAAVVPPVAGVANAPANPAPAAITVRVQQQPPHATPAAANGLPAPTPATNPTTPAATSLVATAVTPAPNGVGGTGGEHSILRAGDTRPATRTATSTPVHSPVPATTIELVQTPPPPLAPAGRLIAPSAATPVVPAVGGSGAPVAPRTVVVSYKVDYLHEMNERARATRFV